MFIAEVILSASFSGSLSGVDVSEKMGILPPLFPVCFSHHEHLAVGTFICFRCQLYLALHNMYKISCIRVNKK